MKLEDLPMDEVMVGLVKAEKESIHDFLYNPKDYPHSKEVRLLYKAEYERRLYGR